MVASRFTTASTVAILVASTGDVYRTVASRGKASPPVTNGGTISGITVIGTSGAAPVSGSSAELGLNATWCSSRMHAGAKRALASGGCG